jgi:3-hydroxyisobutyrate dehydrogenase
MAVAWIGLGNMGGPMAANLVRAGHAVRGFDLSQSAADAAAALGVTVVDSVEAAVAEAEIVFTMLPRGEHVQGVLTGPDGVLAHAPERVLVVDSSTIDIELARDLHRVVRESGRRFLDAPVSGGVNGAAAGALTYMVGGQVNDVEAARPYLDVLGGRILHAGDAGNGQAAKIVNNMMLGVNLAGHVRGRCPRNPPGAGPVGVPLHRLQFVGGLVGPPHLVPREGRGRERGRQPGFRRRVLGGPPAQGPRARRRRGGSHRDSARLRHSRA